MNKHYSRKSINSVKRRKNMWYLSHSLTLPSQLSKAKTPLQTGAVKHTGLLSPQPEIRGLSFREKEMVIFVLSPATFPKLNFKWVLSWGWGFASFCPAHAPGMEALFWVQCPWEYRVPITLVKAHEVVVPCQSRQTEKTSSYWPFST